MKIKFICFSILLFILNSCKLKQEKSDSPNFILFLTDDQSWSGTSVQMSPDHPSSQSFYYETPNLKNYQKEEWYFLVDILHHQYALPLDIAFNLEKLQQG